MIIRKDIWIKKEHLPLKLAARWFLGPRVA